PISKYWTVRLASRTSLCAARRAIPIRPGGGESPNNDNMKAIFAFYSPLVKGLNGHAWTRGYQPRFCLVEEVCDGGRVEKANRQLLQFSGRKRLEALT